MGVEPDWGERWMRRLVSAFGREGRVEVEVDVGSGVAMVVDGQSQRPTARMKSSCHGTSAKPTMPVTVKWARERISFELPSPDTPLSAIRASLADYTHIPQHAFKLVHAGAVMKDDAAPSNLSP